MLEKIELWNLGMYVLFVTMYLIINLIEISETTRLCTSVNTEDLQ